MTQSPTDPDLIYVGTYTENIHLVRMDRRSGGGSITYQPAR
jgi:hypothetical protein